MALPVQIVTFDLAIFDLEVFDLVKLDTDVTFAFFVALVYPWTVVGLWMNVGYHPGVVGSVKAVVYEALVGMIFVNELVVVVTKVVVGPRWLLGSGSGRHWRRWFRSALGCF